MATEKSATEVKEPKKTTAKPRASIAKKKAKAKSVGTSTSKKTTTKTKNTKSTSAKAKGKVLVCANDNECFWTNDGKILKDLNELSNALKNMSDAVFAYHVTKEKNDFAEWVDSVLRDAACAADLRKSKKPGTARTVVVRHLRTYKL